MNYKIAQFILTPPLRHRSILEIYVAQPDTDKEILAGKLFALIEIESAKTDGLKIINFLISTLNHNYYQNEKIILKERVSTIKVEHIFESALAKTNKKLAEFLQAEKIKLNPNLLNLTIGVIYNNNLHFANLGKNRALLIYKNQSDETTKYKLADITEQTAAGEAKKQPNTVKLFSNIISGAIPRNGYFIFANETFGEYLTPKQIIEITTTLPPASAAEQIKNTLNKINAYVPFIGLIIKNVAWPETQEIKFKEPITTAKASLDNLNVTEEKTEKYLTPSGLINAKKWPTFFGKIFSPAPTGQPDKNRSQALALKEKIITKKKGGQFSLKKILVVSRDSFIYFIKLTAYFFKFITDGRRLLNYLVNLLAKLAGAPKSFKLLLWQWLLWFKKLKTSNKIFFAVFLVCLLILPVSLGYENIKNSNLEKQAAIINLTAAIEQKQNQIDASLLYNNESGAKKLLDEVAELLKQLPQNNQAQKDQAQAFLAKHQVQLDKISRVVRLELTEIANLANLNPAAEPKNMLLAGDKIYLGDISQSSIYLIDRNSQTITSANFRKENNLSRLDFPSLDKNNVLTYYGGNQAVSFDTKTQKFTYLNIANSDKYKQTVDLKQYNNRFYLADQAANQIYRFSKDGNKLLSPAPWFTGQEDLSQVTSLDIDGNIYLLKINGEILKFTKGKKQSFPEINIEPAFRQASKIIVSNSENYLYVFEPLGKRLVVFDKDGQFINQYTSDRLDRLIDVQVDEVGKKIYFLNGTTVYSAEASHLKK